MPFTPVFHLFRLLHIAPSRHSEGRSGPGPRTPVDRPSVVSRVIHRARLFRAACAGIQIRVLLALTVVSLVPLALASFGTVTLMRESLLAAADQDIAWEARSAAARLDEEDLGDLTRDLRKIATLPEMTSMDPVQHERMLRALVAGRLQPEGRPSSVRNALGRFQGRFQHDGMLGRFSTFDAAGQRIASSHPAGGPDLGQWAELQRAVAAGEQAWAVGPALPEGQQAVVFFSPIRHPDQEASGVLAAAFEPAHLSSLLQPIGGRGRRPFVVDATGRVLLHSDPEAVLNPANRSALPVPFPLPPGERGKGEGNAGLLEGTARYSVDGAPTIAGYAPLPSFGWLLVFERPEAEVLESYQHAYRVMLAALVLAGILSVLAAVLLARTLTQPLRRLAVAARALAHGDMEAPLPRSGADDELSAMIRGFDKMRRKVAEALAAERAERERFHSLAASVPVGIIETDLEARCLYANEHWATLTGQAPQESSGTGWVQAFHPDDRGPLTEAWAGAAERSAVCAAEFRLLHADDGERTAQVTVIAKRSEDGKLAGLIGAIADVTQRRRAEQALRDSEDRLRQAQKMESVGVLAGGIAHDFNNLLTVINGFSDLLRAELDEADPRSVFVNEIAKAGQGAASLTRQLLAFSRRQVLQPEVLHLNAVVTDMDKLLQRVIGEDIELSSRLDPSLGSVKADRGQIGQVILNLAANARDAMPTGGRLTIETANVELDEVYRREHGKTIPPGRHVMLVVSDTGCGMDSATQARIFEPFFTTKEQGKGTGLGLATVYGIVKQSEGEVWVYSEPGHGTAFKIYLPRHDMFEPALDRPVPTLCERGLETLLLVEDEPGVLQLARTVLATAGYTVLAASGPEEALELCADHRGQIHLLVTDVVMPGMGGRQLAEHIVRLRSGLKVLYMSGYTPDVAVRHGVLEASVAYLQKPFGPAVLTSKVRQVLDGDLFPGDGKSTTSARP